MEKNSEQPDRARYSKMTKEERLQSFKRTIAHPHLTTADKALREAIQETGGASLLNVYGPARVGKSTMKKHVMRTIILEMLPLLEQDKERIPLLSIVPPPPLERSFNWKDFFQRGLMAFDEPLIDHKITLDIEDDEGQSIKSPLKRKAPEGTKNALRQSFEIAAKRRRPIAIFIDEAQHLGKVSDIQLQNQVDCIKSLADDTGTIIVLIGTYQLLPLRNLSAQLIGRSLDIHFPRYRNTEKELTQFKNVLRTFQDMLPFVEESEILLKHWEFCYERSIGCVGNLRLMLVRAVHAALWSDAKALSWNHLKMHAFSEAESYEMMLEAYNGESELASKPDQHTKLRQMLGLAPAVESKTVTQPDTPQTGETASEGVPPPVMTQIEEMAAAAQPTQPSQGEEIKGEAGEELPAGEDSVDDASPELQPVSGDLPAATTNRAEEESGAEESSSAKALSRPLKKPKAEPARPFRRKATPDRTSGPPRKNMVAN